MPKGNVRNSLPEFYGIQGGSFCVTKGIFPDVHADGKNDQLGTLQSRPAAVPAPPWGRWREAPEGPAAARTTPAASRLSPPLEGQRSRRRVRFVETVLSSYARFPPAPLLRGGGPETGAGAFYWNRSLNAPSPAPPTEGWPSEARPGWCCNPNIESISYDQRARIPRRGGTPFSEKGVRGIRMRRFAPRL